jgi:hypothetical protein
MFSIFKKLAVDFEHKPPPLIFQQLRWLVTSLHSLGEMTWKQSLEGLDMFTVREQN